MYKNTLLGLGLLLTTTSNIHPSNIKAYEEDLAIHRIQFPTPQVESCIPLAEQSLPQKNISVTTTHDITQQLNALLVDLKSYYTMNKTIEGYTIQAYTGGSREMAFKIRDLLQTHYPSLNPEVQYKQPHFTVRIGKFLDRLEAYKLYIPIKELIPQAIIRPAHFPNEPDLFNPINMSTLSQDAIQEPEGLLIPSENLNE
jgi:hypothetical protein